VHSCVVALFGGKPISRPHAPFAGVARSAPFPQGERGFDMEVFIMGWEMMLAIVCALGFAVAVAWFFRERMDADVFLEGVYKIIALITSAELNMQGEKLGELRMQQVIHLAEANLKPDEVIALAKKGGIKKVAQELFDILKPVLSVLTLGFVGKKVRN